MTASPEVAATCHAWRTSLLLPPQATAGLVSTGRRSLYLDQSRTRFLRVGRPWAAVKPWLGRPTGGAASSTTIVSLAQREEPHPDPRAASVAVDYARVRARTLRNVLIGYAVMAAVVAVASVSLVRDGGLPFGLLPMLTSGLLLGTRLRSWRRVVRANERVLACRPGQRGDGQNEGP